MVSLRPTFKLPKWHQLTRILQALLLMMLSCNSFSIHASENAVMLILGDSLSAAYGIETQHGWVTLYQRRLNELNAPVTIVNASISGETTDGGLRRLPALLERQRPRWVLIELGANDGLRGFPLAIIENNLDQLIRLCLDASATPIVVGMHIPPNYGPVYSDRFHAVYTKLTTDHRVPFVPFLLDGVYDQAGMIQDDGLHPTVKAQEPMMENVWRVTAPLLVP